MSTAPSDTSTPASSDIGADVRILHVAWEYPPLVYGGLGRHVGALATAQAWAGHDVVVITQTEDEPVDETIAGVRVIRVRREPPLLPFSEDTLLAWVAGLEHALSRAAAALSREWEADVIHGHDWMVAHTVASAQAAFRVPIVATFHATEAGRHQGWLSSDLSQSIHSVEWWLAHQATRVIACSAHMRWEVSRLFEIPESKVAVIPNGIDLAEWSTTGTDRRMARDTYAGTGPLVVFAGRLEWEKGIHTLLDAMQLLVAEIPDARLVIAGKGGKESELRAHAERLDLGPAIRFTGWLPESDLHALVAAADLAVVPSLYEPFGLVALEAAALGTPVVVSRTGGLAEIADGGRVAATFQPGDPAALAHTLAAALDDPVAMFQMAAAALAELNTTYNWERIARMTTHNYESAVTSWDGSEGPLPVSLVVPSGNLLAPVVGN